MVVTMFCWELVSLDVMMSLVAELSFQKVEENQFGFVPPIS